MSKALWYLAGAAALVLAALFAGRAWQSRGNEAAVAAADSAHLEVAKLRVRVEEANARAAASDSALGDTVAYWKARNRAPASSRPPLPTTSTDTATLRLLREERAETSRLQSQVADLDTRGSALERSCSVVRLDCQRVRDLAVDSLTVEHDKEVSALNKVIAHPPPRRKWGAGCGLGYGGVLSAGVVRVGPGGTCGVTISF